MNDGSIVGKTGRKVILKQRETKCAGFSKTLLYKAFRFPKHPAKREL